MGVECQKSETQKYTRMKIQTNHCSWILVILQLMFFLDYCNFATTGLFNFFFHISRALLFPKSILNHYKLVAYKMVSKKKKKQTKKLQRAYSRMMLSARFCRDRSTAAASFSSPFLPAGLISNAPACPSVSSLSVS